MKSSSEAPPSRTKWQLDTSKRPLAEQRSQRPKIGGEGEFYPAWLEDFYLYRFWRQRQLTRQQLQNPERMTPDNEEVIFEYLATMTKLAKKYKKVQ